MKKKKSNGKVFNPGLPHYPYTRPYKHCNICNRKLSPYSLIEQHQKSCCFSSMVCYYTYTVAVKKYFPYMPNEALRNLFKEVYTDKLSDLVPEGVILFNKIFIKKENK